MHRGGSTQFRQYHRVPILFFVALGALAAFSCRRSPNQASKRFFASGLDYFGQEKYDAASIQFRNAIQKEPRAWAPHYWLALTAAKQRRGQDAFREFNVVIELQPSLLAARLDLGDLLLDANKKSEAREQANAVLDSSPKNVRAQVLLAKTYLLSKDYPRAVEEFQKAEQLAPRDPTNWSSCALAEIGLKQFAAAERDFRKALDLDPKSAEAYRNLANLLPVMGRAAEVEPLVRHGLEINPRSLELNFVLADFYFRQKRISDIEGLFTQLKGRPADFPNLARDLGDFWMSRNEVARAATEYQAALAQSPGLLVQKKLVSAYITLGRLNEAEHLNQQILAKNSKDLEGRSFQGALRHFRGDSIGAVEELRTVLKEEPKSLFANYYLGMALMGSGKPEEAETAFTDCIRYNDQFVQAFQRLAELRFQKRDWDAGLEYAKKVVSLTPQRPDGYLLLAQGHVYKGDVRQAEQILRSIQKVEPDSPEVRELLGTADIKQGKVDAGVREYQLAWAHSPQLVASLMRFSDLLVAEGEPDAALRPLQQLIVNNPQPIYYEVLARLYLAKGDPAAAVNACQQALHLDASRWLAHFYLAEAYNRLHSPEEALTHYDEVIRRRPKEVAPYVLAGDVSVRLGKLEQANGYYQAALKQDAESVGAEHGLARLWAEEGSHLDEAASMVQGLQSRFPDDPYLSDTLAWIYYHKGQYALALPLLKRSEEQQPKNALVHFHLGMTYAKVGNISLSRQELHNALTLGLESARWENAARQALGSSQSSSSVFGMRSLPEA